MSWQVNAPACSTVGCVVGSTGSTIFNHQQGAMSHTGLLLTGARLSANGANTLVTVSTTHIRNTANPVLCNDGAQMLCSGGSAAITGSVGNTGIGIDVPSGRVAYFSSTKPTVTGASDTRVGGVAKTYAQIPFVNWDATVPTAITGNGAAIVLAA